VAKYRVIDIYGRTMRCKNNSGAEKLILDMNGLKVGMYTVEVEFMDKSCQALRFCKE